jgi:hypothetical protein
VISAKRLSRINFYRSACLDAESDSSGSTCEENSLGFDLKSESSVTSALFVDILTGLIEER